MKLRFLMTVLLVFVLLMSVNITVSSATGTVPIDLGTLGGNWSAGLKINENGMVIGVSPTSVLGEVHAFMWFERMMTDLGTLGGAYSFPYDLNNAGQIVGESQTSNGDSHAFLWYSGQMTDLGTLGGTYSYASDINASGGIVGCSTLEGDEIIHAVYWKNNSMMDLGALFDGDSCAYKINNRGQILGGFSTTDGDFHGFLYENGVVQDLGYFEPMILTDSGYALGKTINSNGEYTGAIWNGRFLKEMEPIEGSVDITLTGMNNRGQVVGYYLDEEYTEHYFLWNDGIYKGLDFSVSGINTPGWIIGKQENQGLIWFNDQITYLSVLEEGYTVNPQYIATNGSIVGSCFVQGDNPHACVWINP